jgi:photosystem II stability/assembly factor-like uncharacterized protein
MFCCFLVSFFFMAMTVQAADWRLLLPKKSYTVRINPLDANKIVVGGWANQMYRSNDGGRTWETKEVGSLFSGSSLTSLFWSSADTSVLVCAGFNFTGIKRSSDGGETWEQVLLDEPTLRRMWFISEAIIEDQTDPTVLFAARGTIYNSIWRSTDTGATWDSISVISSDLTGRICTIASRPDSTNILFAGCKSGVMFRSDDGGLNWDRVPINGQLDSIRPDSEIPKIVFSRRDPMVGYAVVAIADEGAINGNGGVLKTTDGGWSWDHIALVDTSFWAVDTRPLPDGSDDEVYVGGFRTWTLLTLIKGDSLVFHSSNGGADWTRYEDIPWGKNEVNDTIQNVWSIRWDTVGNRIYMATEVGLYVLDEGMSVNADIEHHSSDLRVIVDADMLHVTDQAEITQPASWSIYSMDGGQRLAGEGGPGDRSLIPLTTLPSGRYVLTWTTGARMRTALFSLVR